MASAIETFKKKAPPHMAMLIRDFNFSVLDAAAVMGNAGHESGGLSIMQEKKPTVAGSRGGFGWFQWTGPRRRSFESYCSRNGLSPTSDKANYAFLFVELKGPEKAAVAKTKAAGTLRAKVIAFEKAFERAGVKHYDSRVKWAERALAAWNASGLDKAPAPPDVPAVEPKPKPVPKPVVDSVSGGTSAAGGAAAGVAAAEAGFDPWLVVFIAVAVAIATLIIIRTIRD